MKANCNGYTRIINSKYNTYQHRIEAMKMLGRTLLPGEVVHHIDNNRGNNDWSNLIVFKSNSDHIKCHKIPKEEQEILKLEDGSYICKRLKKRKCPICKSVIYTGKYCSSLCSARSRAKRKVEYTKDFLWKKVWSESRLAIAKELKVSNSIITKWCKTEDIPMPNRGFWRKVEVGSLEGLYCPIPVD